jgi:hypothetical protein
MKEELSILWTVKLLFELDAEFKAVAKFRGTTRAGVLRQWIKKSYAALPVEAK